MRCLSCVGLVLGVVLTATLAGAQTAPTTPTTINVTGGAAGATQRLPAGQAQFGIRVPLRPNAENVLTVVASNDAGQRASQDINVTQITLEEIVRAQVTAQRLTTEEVKALVADGTIDITNPENFNVSVFIIVLTIGAVPVQVQVPVIRPKEVPFGVGPPISIGCSRSGQIESTDRSIAIPCAGGGGGGGDPRIELIPFEIDVPEEQIEARTGGVIIIEGRIKTLKEFFRVKLLLMNISPLFTLQEIMARLEVPDGALGNVAPASGSAAMADIAPGGEGTTEFIVRGDRIGQHTVTVHFGAMLTAPFLPQPVPISGSASTDLEVKGPPTLDVKVEHPNYVRENEPYTLKVHITNTDTELDALYTSFELDVGADAHLIDEATGLPLDGPAVRNLGDILRGQKVTQSFQIMPERTGPIASCTAGATQNIQLSVVFTGPGFKAGCAIGTLPSQMQSPDGRPTVTVVPTHNTTGVAVVSALVAFFSAPMITATITTGFDGASFRVVDPVGSVVAGDLRFETLFLGTSAIFLPAAPLAYDTQYTIVVEQAIFNEDGLQLASGMTARFTTEGAPAAPDIEAPQPTLIVELPANPNAITKGQLVSVMVDAVDNVGVTRIDLQLDGALIDTKRPNSAMRFLVDTSKLAQGSQHSLTAHAFDAAGNEGVANSVISIAPDTTPPSLTVQAANSIARGRSLAVIADAADEGRVDKVQLFIDGASQAALSAMVRPFLFSVPTAGLSSGPHSLRIVATDGAGNTADAIHPFDVLDDATPPTVVIVNPFSGANVRVGSLLPVLVTAVDNIGISSVETFLDNEVVPRATGTSGFNLPTTGLALGDHFIRATARDLAGNAAMVEARFVLFDPPVDTTPPPAPDAAKIQIGLPVNGIVSINAAASAVEPDALVEILNLLTQAGAQVQALNTGAFGAQIEALGGQNLSFLAVDASGNRSAATLMAVPVPPALTSLIVTPPTVTLDRTKPSQQLAVTGVFADASQAPLTSGVTFDSLNRNIADVSAAGLVAGGQNGNTTVRVSAAGVTPVDVPVTVAFPTITGVTVNPGSVLLRDLGRTSRLTAIAQYSDGSSQPFTGGVTFGSNNPAIATVDSSGLVTGVDVGQTSINVVPNGFPSIPVPVTVERKTLTSISVSPSAVTFIGPGQTQGLAVTGHYSDSSVSAITSGITFLSSNPAVASVAAGVVTSGVDGNASIEVTVAGVAPVNVPVVVKSLVSLAINPPAFTLIGTNKSRQLTVVGTFSDASTINDPSGVTFQTSDAAVATVDAAGLVQSTGVGGATITAHLGALAPAQSLVTVEARVPVSLVITPQSRTFTAVGEAVTLQVAVAYNDNTTEPPVGTPTFSSRDGLVASVDSAGVVAAVSNGATIIDVAVDGLTATMSVTVNIPPVLPPPVIDALDRPRAAEGDRFAIRGRNFGAVPGANDVFVNGMAAEVVTARKDELVAVVPQDGSSGNVQVVVGGQASNALALGVYARRAMSTMVTSALPSGPGPVILNMAGIDVRAGDRVLLSSAADILAPITFTGTLTASVDNGGPVAIAPSANAIDLTNEFTPGVHDLRLDLTGGAVSTGPIHLVVGPDATGVIAGVHTSLSVNHSLSTPVTFINLTDLANNPVPDGTVVAVSMLGGCTHRDRNNNCLSGAGGRIANGMDSPALPGDSRVRNFVVTGGRIDVLFDPLGTEFGVSFGGTTFVQVLPTTATGTFSGNRALAFTPVTLTSLDTAHAPRSQSAVIADGLQKIVSVALQDFRDSAGNTVPDVMIAVSTLGGCAHRDRANNCISQAEGLIANGAPSPELGDQRLRLFTISNDMVDVQYQPGGVVMPVGTTGTAQVNVLPARPSGVRIGNRTFSDTPITLSSAFADQAQVTVTPPSVLADNGDNRVTIVVTGIVDAQGNPVPDGTLVVASTLGGCINRDKNNNCISSAEGFIKNGAPSPDLGDDRMRVLTVTGGQVQAIYSSEGRALATPQTATARVAFLPALSTGGQRIGNRAFAVADVALAAYGSATTSANPQSAIADGTPKTVVISVTNIRDEAGVPVPDGAVVVASTLGGCINRDRNNNCISSAGGVFTNGTASPDLGDARVRYFVVVNGQIEVHYDPQGVLLSVPNTDTARIALLPGRPSPGLLRGTRIGDRAFAVVPVTLTSPTANPANVSAVPSSIVANGADHQVVVTVSGIADAQGLPAPDGTKVVVSTIGGCTHRDAANNCLSGTEGTIDSGVPSPEFPADARFRVHQVANGTVQAVYNSKPNAFATGQSGTAHVQFLPAQPDGTRIGIRAFAFASVAVVGMGSADIAGAGMVARGGQDVYTVTNVRDLNGTPLPDGTKVVVSTLGGCIHRDAGNNCISSSEGTLLGGDPSPEFADARTRVFTIQGGSFTFTFQAPAAAGTSVLQLLPSRPTGTRIGIKAFAIKAVTIGP
ncbi:MAG: Ig-like domain-containing protein [Acidobacteriota bacterium]